MSDPGNKRQAGWYYRLKDYFNEEYGHPVYKIPLHAGFSCPNREDGQGGCTYCCNPSFSPFSSNPESGISEQVRAGRKKEGQRIKYLAYFQSYTNTYAPVELLRKLYLEALEQEDILGLSIATRPDCLEGHVLDLLEELNQTKPVWLEIGLQTARDETLKKINRGHDAHAFALACRQARERKLPVCAHVIIGLPGEGPADYAYTVEFVNSCRVEGIKFHHLQVVKNTRLARDYQAKKIDLFESASAYIPVLCDCLEILSPKTVVHRLSTQAAIPELLIAPRWQEGAGEIAAMTVKELTRRGSWQGCRLGHNLD